MFDVLAQRRLSDTEPVGCSGNGTQFCNGSKVAELTDIHLKFPHFAYPDGVFPI
jgi:hypothetical protein